MIEVGEVVVEGVGGRERESCFRDEAKGWRGEAARGEVSTGG